MTKTEEENKWEYQAKLEDQVSRKVKSLFIDSTKENTTRGEFDINIESDDPKHIEKIINKETRNKRKFIKTIEEDKKIHTLSEERRILLNQLIKWGERDIKRLKEVLKIEKRRQKMKDEISNLINKYWNPETSDDDRGIVLKIRRKILVAASISRNNRDLVRMTNDQDYFLWWSKDRLM